ncbi:MAG: helix-turn-helix transcriptional regulator [Bacteroidales bacterium]|nr:helix-turn-helix transcriptional regulator [Bacteroidales bacterium]
MKLSLTVYSALSALLLVGACAQNRGEVEERNRIGALLDESARTAKTRKDYDRATKLVIEAMELADRSSDKAMKSYALSQLARLDILTWRDAQGWEHAVEAEKLARSCDTDSLLAHALFVKGKLLVVGGITELEARDDEAIKYFQEALPLAGGNTELSVDILFQLSQAYVNKNRFNNPIDQDIYDAAGDYIAKAIGLAESRGRKDLIAKSSTYTMRYYRQGGQILEGIRSCQTILEDCPEDDYLSRSQAWNNLTMLWAQLGNLEETAAAHQQYVYACEYYMKQKADETLQDMETAYQSHLFKARARDYKRVTILLSVLTLLLISVIIQGIYYGRKIKAKNMELSASNMAKEQLIQLVSREFAYPGIAGEHTLKGLTALPDDKIRQHIAGLLPGNPALAHEVADYVISVARKKSELVKHYGLTAREMEVLRLCQEGLSASEMADKIHVSVHTVNNHKQNIYAKLDVRSVSEMLAKAVKEGLL